MQSTGQTPLLGAATSMSLLLFSLVPEVPPTAQWICLILSATASVLTILKQTR
jgi:hypothetical protein